jgi:hypothetical protein
MAEFKPNLDISNPRYGGPNGDPADYRSPNGVPNPSVGGTGFGSPNVIDSDYSSPNMPDANDPLVITHIWAPADGFNEPDGVAGAATVGVAFKTTVPGDIVSLRFRSPNDYAQTYRCSIWSAVGVKLGTVDTVTSRQGWVNAYLPGPVTISAATVYIASVFFPGGYTQITEHGYDVAKVNGIIQGIAAGDGGQANGILSLNSSESFPTTPFNNSNFWVDVGFMP